MTTIQFIESIKHLPLDMANAKIETITGITHFFDSNDDFSITQFSNGCIREDKVEFGDWQTNMRLALAICNLLKAQGLRPKVILEPTCGKGNFILAALQTFESIEEVFGIEIYKPYINNLKIHILQRCIESEKRINAKIHLYRNDVFAFNFQHIKQLLNGRDILIIGNPPWVTNSMIGFMGGNNVPQKSNFKQTKGLDAITGKGNFDIAEYICLMMIRTFSTEKAHFAMLLKNSVIRNIIYGQRKENYKISRFLQYNIDTKKEFNASVSASLLFMKFGQPSTQYCSISDFYTLCPLQEYGWVNEHFVADTSTYEKYKYLDGVSPFQWRSGVKHDCAKVMELSFIGNHFVNGYGKTVDIEQEMVYPLVKSSNIKGDVISYTRKYVIVTQHSTSEDTKWLSIIYPKLYNYLLEYADELDGRGSRVYKNRPRFCMFGIGNYSFMKYKVVISGLYKHTKFSLVEPINGKPVMVDDTCYLLGFDDKSEAIAVQKALNSSSVRLFINSLSFFDAKRMINKDLLMRIDLSKVIGYEGKG